MDLQWLLLITTSIISFFFFLYFQTGPTIRFTYLFITNRHRFFDWITGLLAASPTNTITVSRFGGLRGVVTANPANIEHALKSRFDNFPKGTRFRSILGDFLGAGIFNADGNEWRMQRKTASFEFNTRSLRNFVVESVKMETDTRLVPLLEKAAAGGEVLNVQDVLEKYGFDNVCKVAFGVDPACLDADATTGTDTTRDKASFAEAFKDAANITAERFRYAYPGFWKIKKLLNIGSEKRLKESISTVHDFATRIIRSRLKEKGHADDLLSRFIANEESSEDFLRDIVISFILAGRETTSSALTWFFWLLSSSPETERKILEELSVLHKKSGNERSFDFEELREMHYLHAAITEAMRLYPPVATNTSKCQNDDTLPDGTKIKKGWFMSYNSYAMGRMESIWGKDCREYRPERWIDGSTGMFKPESPFKFLAFHAGPRLCLGKEMAYIQMKSIVACVLERFKIEVVDKKKVPEQMFSLTLRMRGGLPVRVSRRNVCVV